MYNKKERKKEENKSLGVKLRQLRVNSGYTQQNIADALNINRSTYTYYETGKTTPDISTLQALSKIFKVHIDAFLEEEPTRSLASTEGRRPKKIPSDDPKKIGDLSSDEKLLIAMLRTAGDKDLEEMIRLINEKNKIAQEEKQ